MYNIGYKELKDTKYLKQVDASELLNNKDLEFIGYTDDGWSVIKKINGKYYKQEAQVLG